MDALSSIQPAISTAQTTKIAKANSKPNVFEEMLQNALNNRQTTQANAIVDTFESTTQGTPPVSRTVLNQARKLDADGNPIEVKTQRQTEEENEEFRKVFHQFVGQTLYGQMLKSMRETQQKPAYFHGGRAEEIFQTQLDQVIVEKMTAATSTTMSDTMFQRMKK